MEIKTLKQQLFVTTTKCFAVISCWGAFKCGMWQQVLVAFLNVLCFLYFYYFFLSFLLFEYKTIYALTRCCFLAITYIFFRRIIANEFSHFCGSAFCSNFKWEGHYTLVLSNVELKAFQRFGFCLVATKIYKKCKRYQKIMLCNL